MCSVVLHMSIIYAESIESVPGGGGGRHSLSGEGVGGANSDDWRGSLAFCLLCLCLHIYLLIRPHQELEKDPCKQDSLSKPIDWYHSPPPSVFIRQHLCWRAISSSIVNCNIGKKNVRKKYWRLARHSKKRLLRMYVPEVGKTVLETVWIFAAAPAALIRRQLIRILRFRPVKI